MPSSDLHGSQYKDILNILEKEVPLLAYPKCLCMMAQSHLFKSQTLVTKYSCTVISTHVLHLKGCRFESPPRGQLTDWCLFKVFLSLHSHGSRFSTVTRLQAGWMWFNSQQGLGIFSPIHWNQTGSGVHPTSYPMGTNGSFLMVKQPRCEADNSCPSRADVENARSYTSTTPICLHGMVLN
jgi:hypothetical protein